MLRSGGQGSDIDTNHFIHGTYSLHSFPAHCKVKEGLYLYQNGQDPYKSQAFTQAPLLLALFNIVSIDLAPLIWIVLDIVSALSLQVLANYQNNKPDEWKTFISEGDVVIMKDLSMDLQVKVTSEANNDVNTQINANHCIDESIPPKLVIDSAYVATLFLLNPYCILNCLGQSTLSFSTAFTLSSLALATKGNVVGSILLISLSTYLSVYPVMFLVPVVLLLNKSNAQQIEYKQVFLYISIFLLILGGLLYTSFIFMESWTFIDAHYGTLVLVKNLKPNIGLYWYLVIEIFEQFRFFFVFVFQVIAIIFCLPLGLHFKTDGIFIAAVMAVYISFIKSYPSIGDLALYYGLLNCFQPLYLYMGEFGLIIGLQFAILAMTLVFYNLWLYSGAGNANFFYGLTLAKAGTEILLMSSFLNAFQQRNFEKMNPETRKLRLELANLQTAC